MNCISYLLYIEVLICVLACHHINYCVIIYLLEDEHKLSLGMLIRPKRIYNFCLFHDLLSDIVICFATLLYHFTHIWTNLLTQCIQCQFLSADVFFAGDFTQISTAPKIPRKIYKNERDRSFQITEYGPEESQGMPRRPPYMAWPLTAPTGRLGGPHLLLRPPLAYIYPYDRKP